LAFSFITDAFALLSVYGILNKLLCVHNSKATICLLFAFFHIRRALLESLLSSLAWEWSKLLRLSWHVIFAFAALPKLYSSVDPPALSLVMTASEN
jgi:hypothetical protein